MFRRRCVYSSQKECNKELGIWKGCHLSIEGIRKAPILSKIVCKKVGGWTLGRSLPLGLLRTVGRHLMPIVMHLFNENARRTTNDIDKFTRWMYYWIRGVPCGLKWHVWAIWSFSHDVIKIQTKLFSFHLTEVLGQLKTYIFTNLPLEGLFFEW